MSNSKPSHPGAPALGDGNIGMVLMIIAMFLLPVGDTLAKLLTGVMTPVEVTMWRFVTQAVFFVPVGFVMRRYLRGPMFSPIVALSGGLMVMCVTALITAFAVMPIATAIAIFFVEPLVLTLLAGLILGEKVGPRRLIAIGVGLVGAMLVIRPSFSQFGWTAVLPLISAVTYALNMIVLRYASKKRSALTVQCGATGYAALGLVVLVAGLGGSGTIAFTLPTQAGGTWLLILGAGGLSALTFVMIAEAFRRSEAGLLAPFQYLEILGATTMGFLVFGDFPDAVTWLGIAIILAAGFYVFHRERQVGRYRPAKPKPRGEGAR